MAPRVAIVGLGLVQGQVSQGGAAALRDSAWIGHYGLPPGLHEAFCAPRSCIVDLDEAADARVAAGFALRARAIVLDAAYRLGAAALAVAGHPIAANPFGAWLCQTLPGLGVAVETHSASSALDQFMAATGEDLVGRGVRLADALRWMAESDDGGGRALAIWNAGYLDAAALDRLHARLLARFAPGHPLHVFRAGAGRPQLQLDALRPPGGGLGPFDTETTLFVF